MAIRMKIIEEKVKQNQPTCNMSANNELGAKLETLILEELRTVRSRSTKCQTHTHKQHLIDMHRYQFGGSRIMHAYHTHKANCIKEKYRFFLSFFLRLNHIALPEFLRTFSPCTQIAFMRSTSAWRTHRPPPAP